MSISIGGGFRHKINGKYGNVVDHLDENADWQLIKYTDGIIQGVNSEDLEEYPTDMNGRHIFEDDIILYYQKNGFPHFICQGVVKKIKDMDPDKPNGYKNWKISIFADSGLKFMKGGVDPSECIVVDSEIIKKGDL